jgi:hypothetical protein
MRYFFLLLVLVLASCVSKAANVTFTLQDFTTTAAASRKVLVTPLSFPEGGVAVIVSADKKLYTASTNGAFTVTNMVGGIYQCELQAPPSVTKFWIDVPTNASSYNASALMVAATNTVPSGTMAVTLTTADGRYIKMLDGYATNLVVSNLTAIGTVNIPSGSGGTVTSVGLTSSSAGVTITGSPIIGAGNIGIEIAGTGGGNTFNTTQFGTNGSGAVTIKDGAFTTNQTAYTPYLLYTNGTTIEPRNTGVWAYNDVVDYWKFDSTNWTFFQSVSGPTPTQPTNLVTKAYADALPFQPTNANLTSWASTTPTNGSTSQYLRGDGTWQVPPGGGSSPTNTFDSNFTLVDGTNVHLAVGLVTTNQVLNTPTSTNAILRGTGDGSRTEGPFRFYGPVYWHPTMIYPDDPFSWEGAYGMITNDANGYHLNMQMITVTGNELDGPGLRVLQGAVFGSTINVSGTTNLNDWARLGTNVPIPWTGVGYGLSSNTGSVLVDSNTIADKNWVMSIVAVGGIYYASTNACTNGFDANSFWFVTNTIPAYGSRVYTGVTNNQYIGSQVTSQQFANVQSPITVNAYISYPSGAGRALSVKPEIYFSADLTNIFGDYDAAAQTITAGTTNLYQWTVSFPDWVSTNVYVIRRFKVTSQNANPDVTFHLGTNFASHIDLRTTTATVGGGTFATIQSNGVDIVTSAVKLNVVNPSTLVSNAGGVATLTLPSGGGLTASDTNFAHITATNGVHILTNGAIVLDQVGYGSATDYARGIISNTPSGLNLGSWRAGSATTNSMPVSIWTDKTQRVVISPLGTTVFKSSSGTDTITINPDNATPLIVSGTAQASTISSVGNLSLGNGWQGVKSSAGTSAGYLYLTANSIEGLRVNPSGQVLFGTNKVIIDPAQGTNMFTGITTITGTNIIEGELQLRSNPQIGYLSTNAPISNGTNLIYYLNWASQRHVISNHVYYVHSTNGPTDTNYASFTTATFINNSGSDYVLTLPAGWTNTASSPASPLTITNGTIRKMQTEAISNTNVIYDIR